MQKFEVTVERLSRARMKVVVEADSNLQARTAAEEIALANPAHSGWDQPWSKPTHEIVHTHAMPESENILVHPEGIIAVPDPVGEFYRTDEALNDLVNDQLTGTAPAAILLTRDDMLVLSNGDRSLFATLSHAVDRFVVTSTRDPMSAFDAEATVDAVGEYDDVQEAFAAACEQVGLDYAYSTGTGFRI